VGIHAPECAWSLYSPGTENCAFKRGFRCSKLSFVLELRVTMIAENPRAEEARGK
jgi:hypothetical protein